MSALKIPLLRFTEFRGEWEHRKLKDYVVSHKGGASLTPSDFINNSEYEVIPKKAVVSGGRLQLDKDNPTYCTYEFFQNNERSVVTTSWLITTLRDLVPSGPNIGFIVKNNNEKPLILAQGVYGLNISKELNHEFLIQFSNRVSYRRIMQRILVGSTQVHIRNQDFFGISIVVPQHKEQQKIASFLTAVDSKIEQLNKKQTLLQDYKKGVMQEIFSQKIRFKADDGSKFPEWEERTLNDFLILTLREVPKPKENYLAIGVRSHCKGTFQKPNSEPHKIAMDTLYKVKENDLIVSITFAWESAIAIVKEKDNNGLVSHRFPTYTFNRNIAVYEYFKHVIIQKRFRFMLELISPGGAGRNRVMSKKEFLKLKWTIPSIQEQTKIATFLTSIDTKIDQNKKLLDQVKLFKKALLQQMFV